VKFQRFIRHQPKKKTPAVVRAATRAVAKELAQVALFPELAKYRTVDERLAASEDDVAAYFKKLRSFQATKWREARLELAKLPEISRKGVLRYWQSDSWMPRDSVTLLGLLREVKKGKSAWRILRINRQLKLIGEARLPRSVYRATLSP
jgi:DNA-directed RNA polymerase subunit F